MAKANFLPRILTFSSRSKSQSGGKTSQSMTMWKIPTENRTKKKPLIIYHRHRNHRVARVFRVDQLLDELATPNEVPDMKFLFDPLLKVTMIYSLSTISYGAYFTDFILAKIHSRVSTSIQGNRSTSIEWSCIKCCRERSEQILKNCWSLEKTAYKLGFGCVG